MRLIYCGCRLVIFLGTASGVVGFEVEVVVCARCDLAVVRRTCRYGDLVAGVLEYGAVEVTGVGAFKYNLKADVEEILLEIGDMVVIGGAQDFCSILTRLCKRAGDFDDRIHGDDAGIGGEGARWLLGGSSVGFCMVLSVGASVVWSLGQGRRWAVDRAIGHRRRQRGSNGAGTSVGLLVGSIRRGLGRRLWSRTALGRQSGYRLETAWVERRQDVGRAIGRVYWLEPWSETEWVYWSEPRSRTASVDNNLLAYEEDCHGRR